jgi:capsular exopolysaccharide synthesis family protein
MPRRNQRAEEQGQAVANAAQTLFANIRFMSVDNPVHVLAITSSVPNEGKTFVSMNLASAIAASGASTLLVECDMRRRSMAARIGVHAQHGIYSVMTGQVSLEQAAVRTPTKNLYFLDAEPHIPNPSNILNSHHFQNFLDNARSRFDYVVFDTPPVTTFVDAAVLGTKVDAVLLVARENFVKRAELQQAVDQLRASNCNLAGVVMNGCDFGKGNSYYSYYYENGEGGLRNRAEEESSAPKFVPAKSQQVPAARPASDGYQGGSASQTPVPAGPPPRRSQPQRAAQPQQQARATQPQPQPQPTPAQRPAQQSQAAVQQQFQRTHVAGPGDTAMYQRLAEQSRVARAGRSYPRYDDEDY